jgi:hypothetical protein
MNQGKNISAGILLEKDVGERKVNNFTNGFIGYKSDGLFSSVMLGDNIVERVQSLSLWRGYDLRKCSNITAGTIREERGLMSHLSADENGFLRGGAAKFKLSNLSAIIFYSQKNLSSSIDSINKAASIYIAHIRSIILQRISGLDLRIITVHSQSTCGLRGEMDLGVISMQF